MSGAQIKELKQTCFACPSQWEGKLSDGRMIHIRYRWGHLSIRISEKPTDDIMEAVDGKLLLEKDVSENPFDGYMDWFTMMNYLKEALKKLNETEFNQTKEKNSVRWFSGLHRENQFRFIDSQG